MEAGTVSSFYTPQSRLRWETTSSGCAGDAERRACAFPRGAWARGGSRTVMAIVALLGVALAPGAVGAESKQVE
jgi:hypothetical protein